MRKKNYNPFRSKSIDVKFLNKVLAKRIQQNIERNIYHDQVEFISGMQDWFHIRKSIIVIYHTTDIKKKNHMTLWVDAEKVSDKIWHPFNN